MFRRLANAPLDGGLFSLVEDDFETVLHAAEVKRSVYVQTTLSARRSKVIGGIIVESQP